MVRSARMPKLAACLLVLSLITGARTAAAEQETIVFLRHGEKPPEGLGQLDCQGLNRALALPRVLISRYGKADFIFAPNPAQQSKDHGQHYNYVRPLATIEPTAIAMGRPVDASIGFKDIDKLDSALPSGPYRSAVVFVAWEHVKLVEAARLLVQRLGGDPKIVPDWPESDFDSLYVLTLTWTGDRAAISFAHHQEGLNGRSTSCH
jgi:hypothetical protein